MPAIDADSTFSVLARLTREMPACPAYPWGGDCWWRGAFNAAMYWDLAELHYGGEPLAVTLFS